MSYGTDSARAAIVTGSSKGIGYACAERLGRDGYRVVICARHREELDRAHAQLTDAGATVASVQADIGRPEDCQRIVQRCVEEFGRVDALVNNAAIYPERPFIDMTAEAWDETLSVDLRGPVLVSAAAARQMREQGGGRIVHIASINGLGAEPGVSPYNAAKAGIISLTQSMAVDLAEYGIVTNCIAPGWIRTPLSEPYVADMDEERLRRLNPLRRVGRPEEIAEVAAFLCRPEVTFLLGATIPVDGGQRAMLPMP